MATDPAVLTPYLPGSGPILDGGNAAYLAAELKKIQIAIRSTQLLVPQTAQTAPTTLGDGMIRLARAPWRPVAGQTGDAWVWYDGEARAWKLFSPPATT